MIELKKLKHHRLFVVNILHLTMGSFVFCSCRNDQVRPEVVSSLRALGVEQNPAIAIPGELTRLRFYLAGPSALQVEVVIQRDTQARYSLPASIEPSGVLVSETKVGPLSLYSYDAEFLVPDTVNVTNGIAATGSAKMRYAVKFSTSQGEETVVGDTLVMSSDQRPPTTPSPEISLTKPEETAAGSKIQLEGNITGQTSNQYRISWFVSSGAVTNRRSISSMWESPAAGSAAVFFTVRDLKSGFFALKSKEVLVNGD